MNKFDKSCRLLTKKDYEQVFNNAKKIVNDEFLLLYCSNNLTFARLGLALSKKKIRYAYCRNRLKRLIRESFRKQKLPRVDMVLMVKRPMISLSNKEVFSKLEALWTQLNNFFGN